MVEANIKIIEELKIFLNTFCEEAEFRKFISLEEKNFSRNRKLTLKQLIGIIINMPKRSLSVEIQEFFDSLGKGMKSCSKSAFSLQRSKLNPVFFQIWNKWLVEHFYCYYGNRIKKWRSFRIQAVDGTTTYLLNKEKIKDYFGCNYNSHGIATPLARVIQIQDILNDITIWGEIRPIRESERNIFSEQIDNLYEDSLTLFDRGFPSYRLMYLMINQEKPRHFVMRCRIGFSTAIKSFISSGKKSKIIELTPDYKAMGKLREHGYIVDKNTIIKVRVVKINLPSGEKEILLTNLYDEKLYSLEDLKYLYSLRWGIETTYNKQKNQQQMEIFSGHRVICIKQDYGATIFVANLQSLIEKQSGHYLSRVSAKRKYEYRINRNISWACLKNNIIFLFLDEQPKIILEQLQLAFERNLEPVRPGRKYLRTTKSRRLTGKYQTFTNYRRAI